MKISCFVKVQRCFNKIHQTTCIKPNLHYGRYTVKIQPISGALKWLKCVRSRHISHWKLLKYTLADLGGRAGRTPPPMGPYSFVFTYIFTKRCPHRRSMPPLKGARPPTGNPGSATGICHKIIYFITLHIICYQSTFVALSLI